MPAKKNVSKNVLTVIGAGVLGVLAGVAGMFLSKEENREKVGRVVKETVKKGKVQVAKTKKKLAKRK
jgi:dihydroxyacetone kinase-like predicted kinase